MDLSLLDREGLQLVVVPNRQRPGRIVLFDAPFTPRSVTVGKLCDGGDTLFTRISQMDRFPADLLEPFVKGIQRLAQREASSFYFHPLHPP